MIEMIQNAPFPNELENLVVNLEYRPGWRFRLETITRGQGSVGLTLIITTLGYDSYDVDKGEHYAVNHYMIVPAASYNRRSWQRWLFDQILLVERHEAAEFFKIEGSRPYAPLHSPGNDPYLVAELATDEERRTNYLGKLIANKDP